MTAKSARAAFTERQFFLLNDDIRQRAISAILNAPVDPIKPLQVLIREAPRKRKLDQNALMFAGPLSDISEQSWVGGRQFSIDVWHDHCKRSFLPASFEPELCLEGYQKWEVGPSGGMVLIGSTTQLTVAGMAQYIEKIHAFGASLGVMFHTKE